MLKTPIPAGLADELDKQFPYAMPVPGVPYPELLYKAGLRYVVDYIRHCHETQQESLLE
jgi:hypothetical protein